MGACMLASEAFGTAAAERPMPDDLVAAGECFFFVWLYYWFESTPPTPRPVIGRLLARARPWLRARWAGRPLRFGWGWVTLGVDRLHRSDSPGPPHPRSPNRNSDQQRTHDARPTPSHAHTNTTDQPAATMMTKSLVFGLVAVLASVARCASDWVGLWASVRGWRDGLGPPMNIMWGGRVCRCMVAQ